MTKWEKHHHCLIEGLLEVYSGPFDRVIKNKELSTVRSSVAKFKKMLDPLLVLALFGDRSITRVTPLVPPTLLYPMDKAITHTLTISNSLFYPFKRNQRPFSSTHWIRQTLIETLSFIISFSQFSISHKSLKSSFQTLPITLREFVLHFTIPHQSYSIIPNSILKSLTGS